MGGGVSGLVNVIKAAMDRRQSEPQAAQLGTLQGDSVRVGQTVYPASIAIDYPLKNGDQVWVQFTENKSTAVIIGV